MATVYFIRHGATEWNERRLLQGRINLPLLPETRARLAAFSIPEELRATARPVASPLWRARETARLLFQREPFLDGRLIERDYDRYEGLPLEVVTREPLPPTWGWESIDERTHGGESLRQVGERLRSFLLDAGKQGGLYFVVTHKGVLTALIALATGWEGACKPPVRPKTNRVHKIEVGADGEILRQDWNLDLMSEGKS